MRNYDFGGWKGKLRPLTYFSISEDQILDMFQQLVFEMLPESELRP
jgi:hypothetical protein